MTALHSPSAAPAGRLPTTLPGVLAIVALYTLVHATTRLLASGNLGDDDPLDLLLIQTLAPGYSVERGPLYDWLLWLVHQVLGDGLPTFLALKYSLLVGIAGGLFALTRRLTGSPLWAFIAVESMASVYQIFWRFHEGFTHRVGAMALAVATTWIFVRLVERGSRADYLRFAACLGLGLLSEHSYLCFFAALCLAALPQAAARRALFSRRLLAVLPLSALLAAPYASWLLADAGRSAEFVAYLLPDLAAYTPHRLWESLRDGLTFPIFVLAPYIVVLPLVFPRLLPTILRQTPLRPAPGAGFDPGLLLTHLLLAELALILLTGLLFTRADYAVHSLLPLLVLALPWLTAKARQSAPSPARIRAFMAILLAFTITAYLVRSANLFIYEPFCSRCRWGVPYDGLAEQLRQRGFSQGTLITDDPHIGGNLRRYLPQVDVVLYDHGDGALRAGTPQAGPSAVVWFASGATPTPPPPTLAGHLPAAAAAQPGERLQLPWQPPFKRRGYRHSEWDAVLVDSAK